MDHVVPPPPCRPRSDELQRAVDEIPQVVVQLGVRLGHKVLPLKHCMNEPRGRDQCVSEGAEQGLEGAQLPRGKATARSLQSPANHLITPTPPSYHTSPALFSPSTPHPHTQTPTTTHHHTTTHRYRNAPGAAPGGSIAILRPGCPCSARRFQTRLSNAQPLGAWVR